MRRDGAILQEFHRTLAEMCRAGVPLGTALTRLSGELSRGPLAAAAAAMAREVEEGASPASAWERRPEVFPPVYAALVEAGLAAGDLPGTLEEIARHAGLRDATLRRLRRAALLPASVLVLLALVSCFVFAAVLPRIDAIYRTVEEWTGRPFPLPGFSAFFMDHPAAAFAAPALVAVLFVLAGFLRAPVQGLRLRLTLRDRLPVLGPLRLHACLSVFAATLALLLRRGLPLPRSLELAGAVSDHPSILPAAMKAAEDVRGGAGFVDAARDRGLFQPSLLWLLGSGGPGGSLPAALEDVARIEDERFERGMEGFTWALEPILQVCTGVLVLFLFVVLYAPLLRLSTMAWYFRR